MMNHFLVEAEARPLRARAPERGSRDSPRPEFLHRARRKPFAFRRRGGFRLASGRLLLGKRVEQFRDQALNDIVDDKKISREGEDGHNHHRVVARTCFQEAR